MAGPISPTGPGIFMWFEGATEQTTDLMVTATPGQVQAFLNKSPSGDTVLQEWWTRVFVIRATGK